MPLTAVLLVLVAAALHAVWNLLAKDARHVSPFMWWAISIGAIWYGALLLTRGSLAMPAAVWPIYLSGMVAEIAYLVLITRGYTQGDLSQVYPIARGTPPMLVALWDATFLGERLPLAGYVGVGLLIAGVYLASLPSPGDLLRPLQAIRNRPAQIALLAAVCVSAYTVLDKRALAAADPMVYNFWVYAGIAVGYAPFVLIGGHRSAAVEEWRRNWRRILLGSVTTVTSYMLALLALAQTAASYVGAVRATSVLIGAALGWLILKERFGAMRVLASGLLVLGLGTIVVAT